MLSAAFPLDRGPEFYSRLMRNPAILHPRIDFGMKNPASELLCVESSI